MDLQEIRGQRAGRLAEEAENDIGGCSAGQGKPARCLTGSKEVVGDNPDRAAPLPEDRWANSGGIAGYHRSVRRKRAILLGLAAATVLLMLISVNAGSSDLSPWEVCRALLGLGDERSFVVIWQLRMPRVVGAVTAGAGLAIAGCVMQTCLKNPLASPSTLGVSAAATFGANFSIVALGAGALMNTASNAVSISNPYLVTGSAFVCSLGAVLLILALSKLRSFSPGSIVLAGTALSSLFSAGTTIIQYFGDDVRIAAAVFWTFGDLGRVSWQENGLMAIVVGGAVVYFLFMRWNYNAMANGEELAKSLGVKTSRVRFWGLLVSSLLTAVSVAFMGMIGFIGLIAPQIMKRLIGSDHRFLIPASALMGAVVLLAADTVARTMVSPVILPVGAVTSLLGAPLFFYMLLKGKRVK